MATIRKNYDGRSRAAGSPPDAAAERIARITAAARLRRGSSTADLIIEAVFESMALKKRDLRRARSRSRKPGCVLATNTSTLDIDAIAAATSRPRSRHRPALLQPRQRDAAGRDRARGADRAQPTVATALALAKRLGKVGVVVGNCPGFVGNRMMFPYMYEAQFLVEEGATPEQVDRALTDFGMAMGIFAVDDMGGLDVAWRVRQEHSAVHRPGERQPARRRQLCEMGRLGQKTGNGLVPLRRRPQARSPIPRSSAHRATAAAAGIARRAFTDEEIVERTIYALINEGARVLEEGFALRAAGHRRDLRERLRLPGVARRSDVLRRPRRACRRSRAHRRASTRARRTLEPAPLLERLAREGSTFRACDAARAADATATV